MTGYSRNQVPSHDQLFNPTLKAIRALGGSASIAEIAQRVINDLTLPDGLAQFPHGRGRQTELEYRLAWARTYLKQYGLLDSTRGVWSLTPQGLKSEAVEPSHPARTVDTETTEEIMAVALPETESWRETLATYGRGL